MERDGTIDCTGRYETGRNGTRQGRNGTEKDGTGNRRMERDREERNGAEKTGTGRRDGTGQRRAERGREGGTGWHKTVRDGMERIQTGQTWSERDREMERDSVTG